MLKRLIGLLAITLFLGATGCGPFISGVRILKADVALSEAETAGAKSNAVYEYTAAELYLNKAREEHGYSDFWGARRYADKALRLAHQAKKKAEVEQRIGSQGEAPGVRIVPAADSKGDTP